MKVIRLPQDFYICTACGNVMGASEYDKERQGGFFRCTKLGCENEGLRFFVACPTEEVEVEKAA